MIVVVVVVVNICGSFEVEHFKRERDTHKDSTIDKACLEICEDNHQLIIIMSLRYLKTQIISTLDKMLKKTEERNYKKREG